MQVNEKKMRLKEKKTGGNWKSLTDKTKQLTKIVNIIFHFKMSITHTLT